MTKLSINETKELRILITQVKALCEVIAGSIFDASVKEVGRYAGYRDYAQAYNDLALHARSLMKVKAMFYTFNVDKMPSYGDTTWPVQKKIAEQVLLAAKMLLAVLEGSVDFIDDEFDNLENFLKSRLRSVVFSKPEKEIEIQNSVESLLLGRGLSRGTDYDRETGKFQFSGREYIPDFVIQKMNLCIEVKLLREGRRSRIIEEISADITAYQKQYQRILFIVYDLGEIQNEVEFKRDIEAVNGVKVVIVKH